MKSKYLVTPALPYANGAPHLGHLVEHVQVNIFVRALRMAGEDVLCVCGADSHGTPIEMNALKAGIEPEAFAAGFQKKFDESFRRFGIEFDNGFGTTHSEENEWHATHIFGKLVKKGLITKKIVEQLYDASLKRFLPDRMVTGTCPKCKAQNQYGDSCEVCGATYQTTDLLEPKSALSSTTPILKKSEHYFVALNTYSDKLKAWAYSDKTIHEDTLAFLKRWFDEGLRDWDISRDGPYFGFKIPGEEDKYFYVWLDAPIGYISLSEAAAVKIGRAMADYWQDDKTKIIHFIGKDIVYFHTLFWPAMLLAAEYTLPHRIYVHGMLTIDGEKMSKSRGTFILADTFSKHMNPESLRYYYACKLSKRADDIDLNFSDLIQRVNSDLVNKVVNLVSRALPLLHRYYGGKACEMRDDVIIQKAKSLCRRVKDFYIDNEPGRALHEIVRFAEDGNKYLQDHAPWALVKSDSDKAHEVLTTGLYIGKVALALLKPVLPQVVAQLEQMLNEGRAYDFDNISQPLSAAHALAPYEHLFVRLEESAADAIKKESMQTENKPKSPEKIAASIEKIIDIDQFMAVELRAARVLEAKPVEGSDKLIACRLDVGELGERHVFSGLRPHVSPEQLAGRMVVMVVNLAPRKMRFGTSEGMILACGEEIPMPLYIDGVRPGERVR